MEKRIVSKIFHSSNSEIVDMEISSFMFEMEDKHPIVRHSNLSIAQSPDGYYFAVHLIIEMDK